MMILLFRPSPSLNPEYIFETVFFLKLRPPTRRRGLRSGPLVPFLLVRFFVSEVVVAAPSEIVVRSFLFPTLPDVSGSSCLEGYTMLFFLPRKPLRCFFFSFRGWISFHHPGNPHSLIIHSLKTGQLVRFVSSLWCIHFVLSIKVSDNFPVKTFVCAGLGVYHSFSSVLVWLISTRAHS